MLERTRSRPGKTATHVPRLMEAAAIDRFGEPEVLTIHALPVPSIDPGEVLIALDTAGVGPWDMKFARADIRAASRAFR